MKKLVCYNDYINLCNMRFARQGAKVSLCAISCLTVVLYDKEGGNKNEKQKNNKPAFNNNAYYYNGTDSICSAGGIR